MSNEIETLKTKLQQRKNKLAAEEIKLSIKERKMRTRHLIEVGGLVVKAGLDHLATNILYGALLSLKNSLNDDEHIKKQWQEIGKNAFDQEEQIKTPVILKLPEKPSTEIRQNIRANGLKWNALRQEWYGYVTDLDTLKNDLQNIDHELEIIQ